MVHLGSPGLNQVSSDYPIISTIGAQCLSRFAYDPAWARRWTVTHAGRADGRRRGQRRDGKYRV